MKLSQPDRVDYDTSTIWAGPAVHPDLWALLNQKNTLIELAEGSTPYQVVLGVPHHAARGASSIADHWTNPRTGKKGRPADEATGLTGLAVFTALREIGISCKLVIAAHPLDHDPNKTPGSPYWQSVFSPPLPRLLFELHGAGKLRRHMLELSAGQNRITDPLAFGRILIRYLRNEYELAVQTRPGLKEARLYQPNQRMDDRLQTPALETDSLTHAGQVGIRALHLEMKSGLRKPDTAFPGSPRPSPEAWQLARSIAMTVRAMDHPGGIFIPGSDLGIDSTAYLTVPSPAFAQSYLEAVGEPDSRGPFNLDDLNFHSKEDLALLFDGWNQIREDPLPPTDTIDPPVTDEILWLIDQGEFVGRVFFFHWLDQFRRETDGQVDYWIRPSRRQQGYGKLILRLLLERFRQIRNDRILITCSSDNLASRRIIEVNGGLFESEVPDDLTSTGIRRRYWIQL